MNTMKIGMIMPLKAPERKSFVMPEVVRLLLRVPALFPETRPDMFWVSPPVRTSSGGLPTGTGDESIQGEVWQRFSWHLKEGAWDPRQHSMRDFMRCVRARLERGN